MISRVLHALRHRASVGAVAHLTAIRVLALAGSVCSGLLTAAFLGPEGRGEQAALILAPSILSPLCTIGLHASLIYNLRSDPENGPRYLGSGLILTFVAGLAATVLGFLLLPLWLGRYSSDIISLARLALIIVPITAVTPLLMGVLEAHGRFVLANSTLYFQSLGTLATLGILAALGWLTPPSSAAAYVVMAIPTFLYLAFQARRVLRPQLTITKPYPQRMLRYGLKFYGVDILGAMSGYLDQVVIVFLLDPASVGAYAVALSLSRVLSVVQGAVSTVLFPSIAAREVGSMVEMVARAVRVTTVVNTIGAAGLAIVGPPLLVLLYGTRFAPAVAPFLVLLVEAVVTSAARTLAQAFSGSGRPGAVTTLEIAGVATSLAAMLVLVPSFGILGAACAALLGGCMRLAWAMGRFRAVLGVGLPRLLINGTDIAWVAGR